MRPCLGQLETDENGYAKLRKIKEVLQTYDKDKKLEDVELYLARGARLNSITDTQMYVGLDEEVEISGFVRNLMCGLVRASSMYQLHHSLAHEIGESDGHGTFLTDVADVGDWGTMQPDLA